LLRADTSADEGEGRTRLELGREVAEDDDDEEEDDDDDEEEEEEHDDDDDDDDDNDDDDDGAVSEGSENGTTDGAEDGLLL
jgi:hypothetical protein